MNRTITIGDYLIQRLYDCGVRHIFGVAGDFILGFDKKIEEHPSVEFINTCDEQGAGFAADAYARLNGLGAVCITYSVGGLKVANTTAQAYAEKSPVVVISGAPGIKERQNNPLLHHKVRNFETQYQVFQQLTSRATVLDNPATAFAEIDRLIATALRYKCPVYIELPRDIVNCYGDPDYHFQTRNRLKSDASTLKEALEEARVAIAKAKQPVILAGVEILRFNLHEDLAELVSKTNIPVAATLLGKSAFNELHPYYLGVYRGAMGAEAVRQYVETSDCLIMLGVFMSDLNLGIFTAQLERKSAINITSQTASIGFHHYDRILLKDFIRGLIDLNIRRDRHKLNLPAPATLKAFPQPETSITLERLFVRLNHFINDNTLVIADAGDALFAGLDLITHYPQQFMSCGYYASLGFAIPAILGIQLAKPQYRPLVLVGDGSFQMSGMELSTVARYHLNPIVIVINNQGYATERPLIDGKFNDILNWNYSKLPQLLGCGVGFEVNTEVELEKALLAARDNQDSFSLLEVRINPSDISVALKRLTGILATKVRV